MNDNKWRKIRQIRIKPVSIIISIIVLLVFFALTASGNEKEKETEIITETVYSSAASAYSMPTAGITKELAQAADIKTKSGLQSTASCMIVRWLLPTPRQM